MTPLPVNLSTSIYLLFLSSANPGKPNNSCTHLECLFSWNSEKKLFICPCHGSEFTRNGQVLKGPAKRDLERFPIQLVDNTGAILRRQEDGDSASIYIADLLATHEKTFEGGRDPTATGKVLLSPLEPPAENPHDPRLISRGENIFQQSYAS